MVCQTKTNQVVLEAATVGWGRETLTCVEPVLGLTGGESFLVSNTKTNYQIWFDIDNGSVAPTPSAGETLIEVDLSTGYTKNDAIVAIKTAVETAKAFYGRLDVVTADKILLETPLAGAPLSALADVDSGFTLTEEVTGFFEDLGDTAEGIEVTFETTLFDVNSNQKGTLVLDQIIQGVASSLTMGLQEVSKERLETVIGKGFGSTYTPSAGTSLIGFGTSKNFTSSFASAGRLVLHPVRLPSTDRSEDFSYWKTVPQPESISYSGTDKKVLNVTFTALNDNFRPEEISVSCFGDSEQFLA